MIISLLRTFVQTKDLKEEVKEKHGLDEGEVGARQTRVDFFSDPDFFSSCFSNVDGFCFSPFKGTESIFIFVHGVFPV